MSTHLAVSGSAFPSKSPGGTRQSGGMELKIADLMRDAKLLSKSEEIANNLSSETELVELLMQRWIGNKENLIAAQ
mgnify:CR=1 FL=1